MISYTVDEDEGLIDLVVDGAISRRDYEDLIPVLEQLIARHNKLRCIETVRKIGPIDASLWWQDLKWAVAHRHNVARVAVITDHGWIGPLTKAIGALFPAEMRVFTESDAETARAWARSP